MKIEAVTANGGSLKLCSPLSLCINREDEVPADDLTAVFPYGEPLEELAGLLVTDGEETLFHGIVDEQSFALSEAGSYVKLTARSMAAMLLDNEAQPQSYNCPCADDIFRRHILPYGITEYCCGREERPARFEIPKGATQWQAVALFCRNCLGTSPVIDARGRMLMCGYERDGDILEFGGEDGIACTSVQITVRRCKRLSRVFVKTQAGGRYTTEIEDRRAIERGIVRERYLNASQPLSVPVSRADDMLEHARRQSLCVTVECPGRLTGSMGSRAAVKTGGRLLTGLYVAGLRYTLSGREEKTVLTLMPDSGEDL